MYSVQCHVRVTNCLLSLSLSLSHTHTHTHAQVLLYIQVPFLTRLLVTSHLDPLEVEELWLAQEETAHLQLKALVNFTA